MQAVRWMIIFDSITLVTLTVVFDFGTTYSQKNVYPEGYYYVEHIQVTAFCFQELVISSLYIWKAADLLRVTLKARTRRTMVQLFVMNVVIVGMDVCISQTLTCLNHVADPIIDRSHSTAVQASPAVPRSHQSLRLQRQTEARTEHPLQASRSGAGQPE
jgi:hypothetical protein